MKTVLAGVLAVLALATVAAADGGIDLLSLVPTKDYWAADKTEVTAEKMLDALSAGQPDAAAVPGLAEQLGDKEHKVRTAAYKKLAAMGPGVLPDLKKASANPANEEARLQLKELMEELAGRVEAGPTRRLMAIRTLGEMKSAEAVPALRKLLDSKAPFEADYAATALAAIDGRPTSQPDPDGKAIRNDVWLLPKNCGIVAQVMLPKFTVGTVDDLFKQFAAMPMPGGAGEEMNKAKAEVIGKLLAVVGKVGNVRVEGATFGLSDTLEDEDGDDTLFIAIIFRGRYNKAAAIRTLTAENNPFEVQGTAEKIDGVEAVRFEDGESVLLFPSDEQMVLLTAPEGKLLPLKEMAAALKAGKGGLADNADMARLVKSVPADCPAWGVVDVAPDYSKNLPQLAAFTEIVATAQTKGDAIQFTVKGRGKDADAVAKAVTDLNTELDGARKEFGQVAGMMGPAAKPMTDALNSVKMTAEKAEATLTAQIKGLKLNSVLMLLPGMWLMGNAGGEADVDGGPANLPVPMP